MRITLILPLALAACGTAARLGVGGGDDTTAAAANGQCVSPALDELGRIEQTIARTEADIARGFAIDTNTSIVSGGLDCPERATRGFCAGDQRVTTENQREIDVEAAEASLVALRARADGLRDAAAAESRACIGRLGG